MIAKNRDIGVAARCCCLLTWLIAIANAESEFSRCPFCDLTADRIVDRNNAGVVVRDAYPISPGHRLIVSGRHLGSLFELARDVKGDVADPRGGVRWVIPEKASYWSECG